MDEGHVVHVLVVHLPRGSPVVVTEGTVLPVHQVVHVVEFHVPFLPVVGITGENIVWTNKKALVLIRHLLKLSFNSSTSMMMKDRNGQHAIGEEFWNWGFKISIQPIFKFNSKEKLHVENV